MGSIISFFHKYHKHFPGGAPKSHAVDTMTASVKSIQKNTIPKDSKKCDKCGELRKKKELTHIDEIDEDFCENCVNMMRLARDDY